MNQIYLAKGFGNVQNVTLRKFTLLNVIDPPPPSPSSLEKYELQLQH